MGDFFQNILPIFKTVITDAANVGEITAPFIDLFNPAIGTAIKSVSDIVLGSQTGSATDSEVSEIVNLIAMGYSLRTGTPADPTAISNAIAALKGHSAQVAQYFQSAAVVQAALQAAFPKATT